jgi:hypothetical protein
MKQRQNIIKKTGSCIENGQNLHMINTTCIENNTFLYMKFEIKK